MAEFWFKLEGEMPSHAKAEPAFAGQSTKMDLPKDALIVRKCREELGWSRAVLARKLDCSRVLVLYWEQGLRSTPPQVTEWIATLAAAHRALPPPRDWRVQSEVPPGAPHKQATSRKGDALS